MIIKYENINFFTYQKCGCSFIYKLVEHMKKIKFKPTTQDPTNILIIRNPYDRIVSFFVNKIVNLSNNIDEHPKYGDPYCPQIVSNINFIDGYQSKKYISDDIIQNNLSDNMIKNFVKFDNTTFELFVDALYDFINDQKTYYHTLYNIDPHIRPITELLNDDLTTADIKFKNINAIFNISVPNHNIVFDKYMANKTGFTDTNTLYNKLSREINITMRDATINYYIGNKTLEELKKIGGVPADNNLYYNETTRSKIQEIYKNDFELCNENI